MVPGTREERDTVTAKNWPMLTKKKPQGKDAASLPRHLCRCRGRGTFPIVLKAFFVVGAGAQSRRNQTAVSW